MQNLGKDEIPLKDACISILLKCVKLKRKGFFFYVFVYQTG